MGQVSWDMRWEPLNIYPVEPRFCSRRALTILIAKKIAEEISTVISFDEPAYNYRWVGQKWSLLAVTHNTYTEPVRARMLVEKPRKHILPWKRKEEIVGGQINYIESRETKNIQAYICNSKHEFTDAATRVLSRFGPAHGNADAIIPALDFQIKEVENWYYKGRGRF